MPRELERFEAEQKQETLDAMIQTAEINKMYHDSDSQPGYLNFSQDWPIALSIAVGMFFL